MLPALSILYLLVNGAPFLPIGLLYALWRIIRASVSPDLRNLWLDRGTVALCLAVSAVGGLVTGIGVSIDAEDGRSGFSLRTSVTGGLEAIQARAAAARERAALAAPHYVAYDFDACVHDDGRVTEVGPPCDPESELMSLRGKGAFRVPRGTPVRLLERRAYGVYLAELTVEGRRHPAELPVSLVTGSVSAAPSAPEVAAAIARHEVVPGMTRDDVLLALGAPAAVGPCDGGEVLEYRRGPAVLVDGRRRVLGVRPASEHDAASAAALAAREAAHGHTVTYRLEHCALRVDLVATWLDAGELPRAELAETALALLRAAAGAYRGEMRTLRLEVRGAEVEADVAALRAPRPAADVLRWGR